MIDCHKFFLSSPSKEYIQRYLLSEKRWEDAIIKGQEEHITQLIMEVIHYKKRIFNSKL